MKIKKVIFAILTLQIGLYFLIGDFMLEKELFNEFEEFSKRRLANEYNVENDTISERFYFTSCGDEFFRNNEKLENKVRNTNTKRYYNAEKYLFIEKSEYYQNTLEFYYEKVDEENETNLVRFGACRISDIPFISTKIELIESFSTHKDFHAMHYNEQMLEYKVNYIWVIFKWVRISKKIKKN
jgi:hypothetical protein